MCMETKKKMAEIEVGIGLYLNPEMCMIMMIYLWQELVL